MTTHSPRKLSLDGVVFLVETEDWRNRVFNDIEGSPTIGVGHFLTRSERTSGKITIRRRSVKWGEGIGDLDVLLLLRQDVRICENELNELVLVDLTQCQFDALVLFAFNVGCGAFRRSTLLRLLNEGHHTAVPEQLRRWVYSDGKVSEGLKVRRETEVALWNGDQ